MRTEIKPDDRRQPTFIELARRRQIIGATVETIAELGYAQSSLARIAERAGISKGVIGYHFAGKDELIAAVVADVLAHAEEFMRPRIEAAGGGREALRAYIASNVEFIGAFRDHLIALVEIARNARRTDGASTFDRSALQSAGAPLALLLEHLQASGELRPDFDPHVAAGAIRAAIDAVPPRLAADPQLDLAHYGRELAELFERATRRV